VIHLIKTGYQSVDRVLRRVILQANNDIAAVGAPEGTAVLSTGEVGGSKFLREDGDGTCSWQAPAAGSGGDSFLEWAGL